MSIYEERRDRLVNTSVIDELELLSGKLNETLSNDLNLPGSLQALEKPLGLPGPLVQHADEIRQADALNRLRRGFADIEMLCSSDRTIFEEGKSLLVAEEEEDKAMRRKHGTMRWSRPESRLEPSRDGGAKLWNQAAEIEGYFASSTSSDAIVRDKFESVKDTLSILAGPDRVIMDYIPNSRRPEIPESLKPTLGRLRSAYNDVLRLKSRRQKRIDTLKSKMRADDIKADILLEAARLERTYPGTVIVPAHFEVFFEARLDTLYDAELEAVEKERADQSRALADVERANREFEAQKRSSLGAGAGGDRERALQRLDNAYYKYKEIVSNIEVGRKFYNDLCQIVEQFRGQARQWVNERRKEAKSLEEYAPTPSSHHRHTDNATARYTCPPSPPSPSTSSSRTNPPPLNRAPTHHHHTTLPRHHNRHDSSSSPSPPRPSWRRRFRAGRTTSRRSSRGPCRRRWPACKGRGGRIWGLALRRPREGSSNRGKGRGSREGGRLEGRGSRVRGYGLGEV